jgi:hypothetical protein
MRFISGISFAVGLGLSACSLDTPNDNRLQDIFNSNIQLFLNAEKVCLSMKNVRSISVEDGVYILRTESGSGDLDALTKIKASNLFDSTGITQMKCLWIYSKGRGELVGTSFVAYSSGISVSGRTKSIEHILTKDQSWQIEATKRGVLRKLSKDDWFIYEPQ